eukprot:scaffold1801_cov57-Phaeocystis_antarctica.AAC.3
MSISSSWRMCPNFPPPFATTACTLPLRIRPLGMCGSMQSNAAPSLNSGAHVADPVEWAVGVDGLGAYAWPLSNVPPPLQNGLPIMAACACAPKRSPTRSSDWTASDWSGSKFMIWRIDGGMASGC